MHPILFQIRNFFIGTYGLMIVIGLIASLGVALWLARRQGLPGENFYDLAFVLLFSGFLGARLFYILLNFGQFRAAPFPVLFAREGFVFMGGFAAAVVAGVFFMRRRGMAIWETGDIVAPSLAIGHGFGRIGCFFSGCCYGRLTDPDSFWGVSFPRVVNNQGVPISASPYWDHLYEGLIPSTAQASLPVFPTQLFESAANFIIFAALMILWQRRRLRGGRAGQIFIIYLLMYGIARFGVEFFRGDADRGLWFNDLISTSQIMSLVAISGAIVCWRVLRTRRSTRPPRASRGKERAKLAHGK